MIKVSLFIKGKKDLYISKKVYDFIKSFDEENPDDPDGDPVNKVAYKLNYLAEKGFEIDKITIKPEGDQVYRIRIKKWRILGFYEENRFIAISWFLKNEQNFNKSQKAIIKKVANIKHNNQWMYEIGG